MIQQRLCRGAALVAPVMTLVVVLVWCTACSPSGTERAHMAASAAVSSRGLAASMSQNRFDEVSGALLAGITNHTHHTIRVTRASIFWSGFIWPEITIDPTPVLPGQTAPFHISPGRAHCAEAVTDPPVLIASVDGVMVRLPLSINMPGLLSQLHTAACAEQALSAVARLSLRISTREVARRGAPYLLGAISVERTPGSRGVVSVVATLGSVLFDVLPTRQLPERLEDDRTHLRLPVLIGPTRRCDPHARGQASQPFLFAVFTRLAGKPQHRTITVPSAAEQRRLNALLDRTCT